MTVAAGVTSSNARGEFAPPEIGEPRSVNAVRMAIRAIVADRRSTAASSASDRSPRWASPTRPSCPESDWHLPARAWTDRAVRHGGHPRCMLRGLAHAARRVGKRSTRAQAEAPLDLVEPRPPGARIMRAEVPPPLPESPEVTAARTHADGLLGRAGEAGGDRAPARTPRREADPRRAASIGPYRRPRDDRSDCCAHAQPGARPRCATCPARAVSRSATCQPR